MKISTQTGVIDRNFGIQESLELHTEAGFKAIDYLLSEKAISWESVPFNNPFSNEFREYFENKFKETNSYGIEVIQTHAPYRRPFQCDSEGYAMVLEQTKRAIYATKYLHSPYIVAHPVLHPDFNNGKNREKGIDANIRYFSKLAPALKETGVVLCIENLYWGLQDEGKTPCICSDAETLSEVIDTLNETYGEHFAACLDTGHALISGNNPVTMVNALGKRIYTLHIHDSFGTFDDHQIPGRGIIDWKSFMKALNEINYDGYFNFETDCLYYDFLEHFKDKAVMMNALKLLHSVGETLLKI